MYIQFIDNGFKFLPDERGSWDREALIDHEDVRLAAAKWLRDPKNLRGLTAEKFRECINGTILPACFGNGKAFTVDQLQELSQVWDVQLPVCLDTALRWMHKLGLKRQEHSVSYSRITPTSTKIRRRSKSVSYTSSVRLGRRIPHRSARSDNTCGCK